MKSLTVRFRVLAGLSVAILAVAGVRVAAQAKTASLYVRASDATGAPLADVRPGDFELTVDGKPGKITLVTYLGGPRRVMLLVSNNIQQELNPVREGLADFIAGIPSDDEIGLGTTAGQYHPRVDLAVDRTRILQFIQGLPVEQGDNVNMDGLVEVYKRFLEKEARQPVIVVVTTEGSESSSVRDEVFNRFVQDYTARGGMTHVVLVSIAAGGAPPRPTAGGNRRIDNAILSQDTDAESIVTMNITKSTGGRYEIVNSITAIPEKLKEIAAEIKADEAVTAGWYKVIFAASKPPNSVRMTIGRPDTRIQLSQARPRAK
jgi:hypothetical protein